MNPLARFLLLGLPLLILSQGCNSVDCDVNMSCDTNQPTTGQLSVKVSINDENPAVPIRIYRGFIEDSVLYFVDTLTTSKVDYYVDIQQRYSGVATYKSGTKAILAIDGDKVSYSTNDNCGFTCYTVKDGSLRLDLR
jgi:hypothetical protein